MKPQLFFLITIFAFWACSKHSFQILTENEYELVEGEKTLIKQCFKKVLKESGETQTILTKRYNYNNDLRVKLLTGLTKDQGLTNYQLDSLYYDEKGNIIRKVNFLYKKDKWVKASIIEHKYDQNQQLIYESKEGLKGFFIVKNEKYHRYNLKGQLLSTSEAECNGQQVCDSLSKIEYIYSDKVEADSMIRYVWKEDVWEVLPE